MSSSIGCGIIFPATNKGRSCKFFDYTDSKWCSDKDDRKSTTGYIFMYEETPISWYSKKQQVVALSSCVAEYITVFMYVCQVVWLMDLMNKLCSKENGVMTLMIYNVSAINLAKNLIAHGRSIHIDMRFHYLIELVSEGKLKLGYCKSEDQVVDLLIKGVTIELF